MKSIFLHKRGMGDSCQYVCTQNDCMNAPKYTLNPVVFPTCIFSIQHADIMSAFELENLGQISTSMQSHRLNDCVIDHNSSSFFAKMLLETG